MSHSAQDAERIAAQANEARRQSDAIRALVNKREPLTTTS